MIKWLDLFRDTITCPSCQGHFAEMLAEYRTQFPNMLYSRADFLLFTFRAHNKVNRRLNKPIYPSVAACFEVLRNNVKNTTTQGFRITYTNHITRHWRMFQDASGMSAMKKIHEIKKIEINYMSARSNQFEVMIPEDNVLMPVSTVSSDGPRPMPSATRTPGRMVMTPMGFRIQR